MKPKPINLSLALRMLQRTAALAHTSWGQVHFYRADLRTLSDAIVKAFPEGKNLIEALNTDKDDLFYEHFDIQDLIEENESSKTVVIVPPLISEGWCARHDAVLRTIAKHHVGEGYASIRVKEVVQIKVSGLSKAVWRRGFRELKRWNLVKSSAELTGAGVWLAGVLQMPMPRQPEDEENF